MIAMTVMVDSWFTLKLNKKPKAKRLSPKSLSCYANCQIQTISSHVDRLTYLNDIMIMIDFFNILGIKGERG